MIPPNLSPLHNNAGTCLSRLSSMPASLGKNGIEGQGGFNNSRKMMGDGWFFPLPHAHTVPASPYPMSWHEKVKMILFALFLIAITAGTGGSGGSGDSISASPLSSIERLKARHPYAISPIARRIRREYWQGVSAGTLAEVHQLPKSSVRRIVGKRGIR